MDVVVASETDRVGSGTEEYVMRLTRAVSSGMATNIYLIVAIQPGIIPWTVE